jgi:dynein heavy chain, axonemal
VAIANMEVGLKDEEIQLKEASDKTAALLDDLEKESKKANQKSDEVELTTMNCKKQQEQIAKEKDEAEKELQAALPALKRAQDAVDNLKQSDIVEMKSNRSPLDIIKYIMDVVLVFFQVKLNPITVEEKAFDRKNEQNKTKFLKESYEESGRVALNDMGFMKRLKDFEKDQINEETIELLEPYLSPNNEWFNETSAAKTSMAAAGILKWALAIYEYHEKSKIVKPKKINLALQEGRLQVATNELRKSQADLDAIRAYLGQLRESYSKQMDEKQNLENKLNKTKKKINTARTLIGSLSGERDRWSKGAADISEQKRRLVGNVSLSTAFISYCGPFNSEFRALLSNEYFFGDMKKKGIPVTPGLDLVNFLVDDATIGEWNLQGLPKDDLSVQNGIMVTNSTRYPLLIDPQLQGQNWIRNKYKEFIDPQRSITTLNHPKFKDMFLKHCMEFGLTLIVEGIENDVDPMLDPVLDKQIQTRARNVFIDVGGTMMDYNDNFKLFLTCRLANPSFSPELSAKTTIIDFAVTQTGLEQQLLGRVLSKEQRALEDSLNQLLADVNFNKRDLQRLDKNLLERLTNSTGNLLDDTELMDVLNSTKTQAKEVSVKLAESEVTTKAINEKREQYRPVAIRGSVLYFCIIEVALINWMYNSSLEQFLRLFDYAIDNSEKETLPSKRVDIINRYLTFHVYSYVNRGLFEKDKATFVLMICFKILTTAQKLNGGDISIFLKGGAALDSRTERAKPNPSLNDKAWMNCLMISRHHFNNDPLAFFRELPDSLQRNENQWKAWIDRNDPENFHIPDFHDKISNEKDIGAFLSLCLIRGIRPDRTLVATSKLILSVLGEERYVQPISYPIEKTWS